MNVEADAYRNMLKNRFGDHEAMVADAVDNLLHVQARDGLTEELILELANTQARKILFGSKPIPPHQRKLLRDVLKRLAAVLEG